MYTVLFKGHNIEIRVKKVKQSIHLLLWNSFRTAYNHSLIQFNWMNKTKIVKVNEGWVLFHVREIMATKGL
jgi:hypothetical protein